MKRNNKGFTLIEILVAMAITGVVASAAFSLFLYGNKIFGLGNSQYNVQSNIRLAANQLNDEMRYAVEVEILPVMDSAAALNPAIIPHYINYVYYDNSQKAIIILNRNESRSISIQPDGQLGFVKAAQTSSILSTITSTDQGQEFFVDSEIYCLNLSNGVNGAVIGSSSGEAVKYTTNTDYISSKEAPLATIVVNTPKKIEIDYSKNIKSEALITKITSQGSLKATLSVSVGRIVITIPSTPPKGSKIVFNAGIYGIDPVAYDTYTYTLTYNNKNGTWSLSE